MDRPFGGRIQRDDSERAPLRTRGRSLSGDDSHDDRRRGRGKRGDRRSRSRGRSRSPSSSYDSRRRGQKKSRERSRSRDRTRRGRDRRDRRRGSRSSSQSYSPDRRDRSRKSRGRGGGRGGRKDRDRDRDRLYRGLRNNPGPDLTDTSTADGRGRDRRGRDRDSRRRRGGDRDRRDDGRQKYEQLEGWRGRRTCYEFQYGNFGNVLQVLLFGVAPGWLPIGALTGMKPEGAETSRSITGMPTAYKKDDKQTAAEMHETYAGNGIVHKKTERIRKDCGSRVLLHAMVWIPLIDMVVDLIIMIGFFRNGWLLLYSIVFVYTCRSGLIGYFLHSQYHYTLQVNFATVINTLVPLAWGRIGEVYHDFILKLEITAWLGFIQWPVRMGIQSFVTYLELRGGPGRPPAVGENHLDMLQLAVVNAIARPVPMFLVQFIAYSRGDLPLMWLVISGSTGVLCFWWLYFQTSTKGAIRGLQAVKQRTLLQPSPREIAKFNNHVTCMDWSPDGKTILIGFSDGRIQAMLFGIKDRKPTIDKAPYFEIGAHNQEIVNDCHFAPNGEFAVTCGNDSEVCVWHTSQSRIGLDPRIGWKMEANHKEHRKAHVLKVKFSPTMTYVASGCEDGDLLIWDWDHQTRDSHADHVEIHQLSRTDRPGPRDNITMIGWDDKGTRCVACTRGGRCIEVTIRGQKIREIDFGINGTVSMGAVGHHILLTLGNGNNINMYDSKKDNTSRRFVAVLCLRNNSENMKDVTEIVVKDLYQGGTLRKMCLPHGNPVGYVAICKDTMHCVTAATSTKLWNMQTGECTGSGQMDVDRWEKLRVVAANCGAIHPSGRWVCLGSKNGQITAFDFSNWRYNECFPRRTKQTA